MGAEGGEEGAHHCVMTRDGYRQRGAGAENSGQLFTAQKNQALPGAVRTPQGRVQVLSIPLTLYSTDDDVSVPAQDQLRPTTEHII